MKAVRCPSLMCKVIGIVNTFNKLHIIQAPSVFILRVVLSPVKTRKRSAKLPQRQGGPSHGTAVNVADAANPGQECPVSHPFFRPESYHGYTRRRSLYL